MPLTTDEIASRGQQFYERLLAQLGPDARGQYVVINVDSGEYEMDADDEAAAERATQRFGNAPLFAARIGYPAAYRLGSRLRVPA